MRDQIDVLLDKVGDPALKKDLRAEIERLRAKRSFGLVFESHLPERVRPPDHAVRVGGTVVNRDGPDSPTYEVITPAGDGLSMRMVRDGDGASLAPDDPRRTEAVEAALDAVVVIAEFGAPIHPWAAPPRIGRARRGQAEPRGDQWREPPTSGPWRTLTKHSFELRQQYGSRQ